MGKKQANREISFRFFHLYYFSFGFGNLGRNTFRGPSQKRLDLSIVKNTRINERMSFEVGFDLFNVFNTVNFSNPNNDLQDSVDFGIVTNTVGGPRVGQFRAKFRF